MEEASVDKRRGGARRGRQRARATRAHCRRLGGIGIALSLGSIRPPPRPRLWAPLPLTNVTPAAVTDQPRSGALFSVADDLDTHEVVLFGGVDDWDNTWVWNGDHWTQLHPAVSPPGRYGASAAYDPQTKMVMLFGGRTEAGTPVHDTWGWDGGVWQDLDSGAGGPDPGEGSDMAWDAALTEMVLTTSSGVIGQSGQTWVWAGTHWARPRRWGISRPAPPTARCGSTRRRTGSSPSPAARTSRR